jgi:hypothetical protein
MGWPADVVVGAVFVAEVSASRARVPVVAQPARARVSRTLMGCMSDLHETGRGI